MPKTYTNLLTHVVFSAKERLPLIEDEIKPRLFADLGGIVREVGGKALITGGTSNHVHLLIGLPPTLALSDVVRVIKTNSSRWMHEQGFQKFEWQRGFGAFSVGSGNTETVKNYIAKQEEHHKKVDYQNEFTDFLKRSGVEFNEQYLWS